MRLKPDPNSARQKEIQSKITQISRNGRMVALNKDILWWRKRRQRRLKAAEKMTTAAAILGLSTDQVVAILDKPQSDPKAKGRSISELMHANMYVLAWKLFRKELSK